MFKFKDSNYLTVPNHPEIKVGTGVVIENGGVFKVVNKEAVQADPTDTELYFMFNIIDKPEIENTSDYSVKEKENVRAYRMKDCVGLSFDGSADILSNVSDYSSVVDGSTLIPTGTDTKLEVGSIPVGGVGFKVVKKNTFGQFTVYKGTDIPGGFELEVVLG